MPEHHPAQTLIAPYVPVDRHVAQAHAQPLRQLAGDLLRAPLLFGQERFNLGIHLRRMVLHPPTSSSAPVGLLLGLAWYVKRVRLALVVRRVAPDLTTQRAGAAAKELGNAAERSLVSLQRGQGVSFRLGELAVHRRSSLPGVIPFSLPAHHLLLRRRRCCTYFVNLRGLTIRSSRARFAVSDRPVPHRAGRLNSGVRCHRGNLACSGNSRSLP